MREMKIGGKSLQLRETVADRVVSFFNPVAGLERMKARALIESTTSPAGGWQAGRRDNRMMRYWRPYAGSANATCCPTWTRSAPARAILPATSRSPPAPSIP
jgi:hypothetical protein